MKVKGFVRSRMRESRTYGSVRGGYRKVSVYSIVAEISGVMYASTGTICGKIIKRKDAN